MSAREVEIFLARLYTDEKLRDEFLVHPQSVVATLPLTHDEKTNLSQMDFSGLRLAATSFAHKRAKKNQIKKHNPLRALFRRFLP